jgi:DsbC/DsbD-like thiol-disulfide interchange protein
VAANLIAKGNGSKELVVKIKIHPGYHLYSNVAAGDPYISTTLAIDLPDGYTLAGEMQYPLFKPYTSNGTAIYEDEIVFRQPIRGSGTGEAKCTLKYQCCDDHICFPPVAEELLVNL